MSLVGPRPEDPKFILYYEDKWDVVLSVRPGIAGPNQIANRNEEDLFPCGADPERFYVDHILPEKLDRDVEYARNHTMWGDIVLLYRAVYVIIFKGFSLKNLIPRWQTLSLLLADTGLSVCAYLLANFLKYEAIPMATCTKITFVLILIINPLLFLLSGLYKRSTRFFSVPDVFLVVKIGLIAGVILVAVNQFVVPASGHSRAVFALYSFFLVGLLVSKRFFDRIMLERGERDGDGRSMIRRVLIYGAGRRGTAALTLLQTEPGVRVVGFVDDDPQKKNCYVAGLKVLGTAFDLPFLTSLYDIEIVCIAFKPSDGDSTSFAYRHRVCEELTNVSIFAFLFPSLDTPSNGSNFAGTFQPQGYPGIAKMGLNKK
jgi:hypothetical protein